MSLSWVWTFDGGCWGNVAVVSAVTLFWILLIYRIVLNGRQHLWLMAYVYRSNYTDRLCRSWLGELNHRLPPVHRRGWVWTSDYFRLDWELFASTIEIRPSTNSLALLRLGLVDIWYQFTIHGSGLTWNASCLKMMQSDPFCRLCILSDTHEWWNLKDHKCRHEYAMVCEPPAWVIRSLI